MAKSKAQKRKQAAHEADLPNKKLVKITGIITPPPDSDNAQPKSLGTVVSDEELEITVETLATLAQHPSLIKSKACKDLRAAVYDFRQASATGLANAADTNLTGQVTGALADGKYTEARIKLAEMRIRGQEPKLGALCRWVRDLDVISGVSTAPESHGAPVVQRTAHQKELITVIDAVLRTAGHLDTNLNAKSYPDCPIALQTIWDLRPSTPSEQVYASVLDKSIFASAPPDLASSLRIIETTPGPQRKPPNHHDAILYTSAPNTIPLSAEADRIPVQWHSHPTVPGLGLATNVLSAAECKAIIAAGESVGFVPDAPLREDGDVSVLAHNFYWVTDVPFHDALWARVAALVPASAGRGRPARGLNRRFRVYRYVPGAEYRAHIDGAWPPSGIVAAADSTTSDRYVYDASPPGRRQSSLFTFLIYLNDEFEGGETTFFLPAAAREGTLNAYPVRPVMGAVAVFPHGDPRLAVLHEGTGVRSGAKYVIRTEVEYDIEPTEV